MAVKDNLIEIYKQISYACSKNNLNSNSLTLIAVSKGRSLKQILAAIEAGVANIGENRVQEALAKLSTINCKLTPVKWHMVGHLQTNKAKDAVKIFDLIHSVDSLNLALEINKQAIKINKVQDVLLEVKTSSEATKTGIKPDDVAEVIAEVSKLKNISIKGLMTVAPLVDNPEKARPYFRQLRQLKDRINELGITDYELQILSMGMSDDFKVAIEEGSTMVRLGRAIFER